MIEAISIFDLFSKNKMSFYTGIPDSLLKDFCAFINDNVEKRDHIIAANEGNAVAIATGYHIATGKIPIVYMQNSGIGNAINPLLSLADEKVYKIPLLLMIGWRGEPGIHDEPQHIKQGEVTLSLLEVLKIPFIILENNEEKAEQQIISIIQSINEKGIPHAIVIRKDTFMKYQIKTKKKELYSLSREESLSCVINQLSEYDIVVSSTGKLSRELFEIREYRDQGHAKDFLTVGSMGHSSSFALGIAIQKSNRSVFCFDGDGAFIMHTGAIATIGKISPSNFYHIVFNNGAHESVGAQPTAGFDIDIPGIALASGYKFTYTAKTREEIANSLISMKNQKGPCLLEIRINCNSRSDLGRPTTSTIENKVEFMNNLELNAN